MKQEFERRLKELAEKSMARLPDDGPQAVLEHVFEREERKEKRRPPKLILAAAVLLVLFTCVAAAGYIYWFPSFQKPFRALQESGYVNVYNKTEQQNGIRLTVQAIVSDQLTTYVRIRASGGLPEREKGTGTLGDTIENAWLSDSQGNRWSFRNQVLYQSGQMTEIADAPALTPELQSERLGKDEMILIFHGGPKKDTTFSLEVAFRGKGNVTVDGLEAKIPPAVERETERLGLTFQTDYAKGTVTKIQYTQLETRFTIRWEIMDDGTVMDEYCIRYKGMYRNGERSSGGQLPYPHIVQDGEAVFSLPLALDPYEALQIDRYEDQLSTYVDSFLFIPGMEKP